MVPGTYIAPRIEQPAALLAGFSADMAIRGHAAGSLWIEKATGLPDARRGDGAGALARPAGASRHPRTHCRWRAAGDRARRHSGAACLPSLDEIGVSLYAALEARGAKPVRGPAAAPGLARDRSGSEAALVCPVGAAILRIERRGFLPNGTPVEFTRSAYRGDRYDFVVEVRELRSEGGRGEGER